MIPASTWTLARADEHVSFVVVGSWEFILESSETMGQTAHGSVFRSIEMAQQYALAGTADDEDRGFELMGSVYVGEVDVDQMALGRAIRTDNAAACKEIFDIIRALVVRGTMLG